MIMAPKVCLILLAVAALLSGAALLDTVEAKAQVTQAEGGQIAQGQKVYKDKKCAICHVIKGRGGKLGGDLSKAGAKRNARWLRGFMKNPKAVMPKVKMMPFRGSDEELDALVAYLASLK